MDFEAPETGERANFAQVPRRSTMNRSLAFICALLFAFVTVSSACMAQSSDWVGFTLEPERNNSAKIHARFRDQTRDADKTNWSTGFMPSELIGLEVSSFRGPGS